jgi:hypothetical protein
MCTRVDTDNTTKSMVKVRASTEKIQFTSNKPESNQFPASATMISPRRIAGNWVAKRHNSPAMFAITIRLSREIEIHRVSVARSRKFIRGVRMSVSVGNIRFFVFPIRGSVIGTEIRKGAENVTSQGLRGTG